MDLIKSVGIGIIRTKLNVLFNINKEKAGEMLFDLFCKPYSRSITMAPPPFSLAEKCSFSLNGEQVNGYRINAKGHQKILILHGFSSNIHRFEGIATTLSAAGFEVYAFDAPAHGYSGGERIHVLKYVAMIKKLHALYGPFDGFVAHSLGGLAISLALEEIPHTRSTKLVLMAPATETNTAIDQAMEMLKIEPKKFKPLLEKQIIKFSGHAPDWFSINRAMQNIQASVLWIHDEKDEVTPLTDVKPLQMLQPDNLRFSITKGLGHNRIYREPKIWMMVSDFMIG